MHHVPQRYGWLLMAGLLVGLGGCLNPNFVNATFGGLHPVAPGNEPFVSVRVINDTTATLDIPIVYDDGTTPTFQYFVRELTPEGRDTGLLLRWPVLRIAVGNLDNPFLPFIIANFPDGSANEVYFGRPALQAGVDFDRGDTIIFHFTNDSRSEAFIRVSVGRIRAGSQPATFSRGNPYERLRILLDIRGF
jgi:hypothetical protein